MNARKRITKVVVDKLVVGATVWDSEVRGFGVRRQLRDPSYILKYRSEGKQRFETIGKHGAPWTPETARGEARRMLGAIHSGDDPAVKREARKREPTLALVLDRYLAEHVATRNKASTAAEAKRQVERNIKPALGQMRISQLTRADVKRWHSTFSDRPYEGNRALAYLRKALTLASKDWELCPANVALGIGMFNETRRTRFYSDEEMSRIGAALTALETDEAAHAGAIRAVRLLALSGMRLSEVLGMRWEWIDFPAGCVRLPDAKAGARTVPLGGTALLYLNGPERIGAFVCFGVNPEEPTKPSTFYKLWRMVRASAALGDGRPHDLRHTVGTYAGQTNANAFGVRDLMGHKTLEQSGHYVNSNTASPLRALADAVSGRIGAAMASGAKGSAGAEVVPLRNRT